MFFETTRLEDDLLDDGADCVIALPPTRASSRVPGNPPADCGHLYCTYSTKTVNVNLNMLAKVVIQCTAV